MRLSAHRSGKCMLQCISQICNVKLYEISKMSSPLPPYLGSKISIISKSEIRYEGILYTVDPKESTIALAKVKSFGTEGRPTERPLAPRDEVYEYIIFRASDIKDLHVCEGPKSLHGFLPHDPAIVSQSGPVMHYSSGQGYNAFYGITGLPGFPSNVGSSYSSVHPFNVAQSSRPTMQTPQRKGTTTTDASVQVSVGSTDGYNRQGFESREPLRQRNQMNYPQRRRGSFNRQSGVARRNSFARRNPRNDSNIENYEKEYDFEQANAEFQELENKLAKNSIDLSLEQSQSGVEDQNSSYDREKSFFDDISCEATQISKGFPRFDWRLERKLNVETFGASANSAWLRRRRGRGNMRRGFNRMSDSTKTVTFDEKKPVVKEIDNVITEEVKSDPLPIIEVVMDKEKSEWPENKVDNGIWN